MKITDSRVRNALLAECAYTDGKLYSITVEAAGINEQEMEYGINTVKTFLKQFPRLYEFLHVGMSPGSSPIPHLTPQKVIRKVWENDDVTEKLILNIGSGIKKIHEEILNLDIYPYALVDIVADAAHLPFKDESVDMIICESVIEHSTEPFEIINEIKRVLSPGGYAFVSLPFLYPYHASPNDFIRLSRNALRQHLSPLIIVDEGMRAGPMAALQGVLMHLVGMLFSFGSYTLYLVMTNVAMVFLAPCKLLDLFFYLFPYSHEIAADIYVLAQKRDT